MNQIPSVRELCGECPCRGDTFEWAEQMKCKLYPDSGSLLYGGQSKLYRNDYFRLPICIEERPQIVKEDKEDGKTGD